MIERVRLKNWKSHLDSEIVFSEGVNALVGIMGSGKSSVMQAISFTLFGTFPILQTRRIGLDDLIMKKPQKRDTSELELDFILNGNRYSIKRVIKAGKGTTHAEIRENGKLLDVNPKNVTSEVERILGMDYDLFSRAVYSEQNGLDHFLRIPRGHRMEQIDRMLKVDRFERARENTVSLSNRVKQSREEIKRIVSDMEKEGVGKRIETLLGEIGSIRKEKLGLKGELSACSLERVKIEKEMLSLEKRESEINSIREELEGIRSGLREIIKSLERREGVGGDHGEELKTIEKELESLKSEMGEKEVVLESKRSELASLNTEIRIILDSIKEMESLKGRCPVCDSSLTPERKGEIINSRKERERGLRKGIESVVSEIGKISREKDGIDKKIADRERLRNRFKSILEGLKEVRELEKRRDVYEERKSKLEDRLSGLEEGFDKERVSKLRSELGEKKALERELEVRISNLKERISEKEEVLKELREREQMLKKYMGDIETHQRIMEDLGSFVKALKTTQDQLRSEFLKTVNTIMNSIWEELYPYGDFSGIRLVIDNDYSLELRGSEGWISVDGIASGGERSMACLALRIAFSLAFMPKLRWLVLDEPTHNLDSNSIMKFGEILRERIGRYAQQVFLITHEDRLSEGLEGMVYRLERDKEKDGATRVVRI